MVILAQWETDCTYYNEDDETCSYYNETCGECICPYDDGLID